MKKAKDELLRFLISDAGLQHQDRAAARRQVHFPGTIDGYLLMPIVLRLPVRVHAIEIDFALLGANAQAG